jgi:histidinol-phosphate aminotransferase
MTRRYLRPGIDAVPPYIPGRSKERIAEEYGIPRERIVKLASNENPLGPSPKAVEEIRRHAGEVHLYPDPTGGEVRVALSRYLGCGEEELFLGNGSDEILDLLGKLFLFEGRKAAIPVPTFPIYEQVVLLCGASPLFVPFGRDFRYTAEGFLEAIREGAEVVFLCSPNNPTGGTLGREDLEAILGEGVPVIVDEAYAEFSGTSHIPLVREYENLIVLRTFSKAFGLAGLRIGYAVARREVVEALLRIKMPFNVSILAQKGALGALSDRDHLERSLSLVREGRTFLREGLERWRGIHVYPSEANFLFLRLEERKGTEVAEGLLKEGIIVRECSHFRGLDDAYLRVSIGTREENERFLQALGRVLDEG